MLDVKAPKKYPQLYVLNLSSSAERCKSSALLQVLIGSSEEEGDFRWDSNRTTPGFGAMELFEGLLTTVLFQVNNGPRCSE